MAEIKNRSNIALSQFNTHVIDYNPQIPYTDFLRIKKIMKPLYYMICLTALVLSACGQKGPLYLPEPQQNTITKEKQNGHSIHKNAWTGQ